VPARGAAQRCRLDEWLSVKRRQGTRASTLRGYEWLIRQHIRPGLGGIRLDKLTPTDIRHLVERKAESGLSARAPGDRAGRGRCRSKGNLRVMGSSGWLLSSSGTWATN
jgi:hypothetical protein